MSASKDRLRWAEMPPPLRSVVEDMLGGRVTGAVNCPDGFSPGLASRLTLEDGRGAFVKAVDGAAWPDDLHIYRDEAAIVAHLPATVPAPRCLGTYDDGAWVIMAFALIDGRAPAQPWTREDLERVLAAADLGAAPTGLDADHPRLGGWDDIGPDSRRAALLRRASPWAYERLAELVALEQVGCDAARGDALVHCDVYAHNILLTPEKTMFVDWPHARRGSPLIDRVIVLATAARDGIDPEPYVAGWPPGDVTAVLAAHAGFLVDGGLGVPGQVPSGLKPIVAAKRALGLAATEWLRQRLDPA